MAHLADLEAILVLAAVKILNANHDALKGEVVGFLKEIQAPSQGTQRDPRGLSQSRAWGVDQRAEAAARSYLRSVAALASAS